MIFSLYKHIVGNKNVVVTAQYNVNSFKNYNNFVNSLAYINYNYFDYTLKVTNKHFKKTFFNNRSSFQTLKKVLNLASNMLCNGSRILLCSNQIFNSEAVYFNKYVFGLRNIKENSYILNNSSVKTNSFFWKRSLIRFSVNNGVKAYVIVDNSFITGSLDFLNSTLKPVICFIDPGYFNKALSYFVFIENDDYILRYVFISYLSSFYWNFLYKNKKSNVNFFIRKSNFINLPSF